MQKTVYLDVVYGIRVSRAEFNKAFGYDEHDSYVKEGKYLEDIADADGVVDTINKSLYEINNEADPDTKNIDSLRYLRFYDTGNILGLRIDTLMIRQGEASPFDYNKIINGSIDFNLLASRTSEYQLLLKSKEPKLWFIE